MFRTRDYSKMVDESERETTRERERERRFGMCQRLLLVTVPGKAACTLDTMPCAPCPSRSSFRVFGQDLIAANTGTPNPRPLRVDVAAIADPALSRRSSGGYGRRRALGDVVEKGLEPALGGGFLGLICGVSCVCRRCRHQHRHTCTISGLKYHQRLQVHTHKHSCTPPSITKWIL